MADDPVFINFPSGLDRADGITELPIQPYDGGSILLGSPQGTPTPAAARKVITSNDNKDLGAGRFFEEDPSSPHIERAEQGTIVHKFTCDSRTGYDILVGISRGTVLCDSAGNVTKVLSVQCDWDKGERMHITMTAESLSFDPPPDEFSYDVIEFNPALQKHPRYSPLTRSQIQQVVATSQMQNYLTVQSYSNILGIGKTETTQQQAATELLYKLRKGIDSFYLPGFRVTFSRYYYSPQFKNPGGYIEDPVDSGNLPAQFWRVPGIDPGDDGADNSFTALARELFPLFYGNGITWLRLADNENYQRTWFRHTQTWIGAPAGGPITINNVPYQWRGHWDEDIYDPTLEVTYNMNPNQ